MGVSHLPVMLREVVEYLRPEKGKVYLDATVGLGGHAFEILGRMGQDGRLIGIDRDEEALNEAKARFISDKRCVLMKARFSEMGEVAKEIGIENVDGVLFDFGVSMLQFKDTERGFSFNSDAGLDMRMDRDSLLTASDIVNRYPEAELERILREYGEEPRARRVAKAITFARKMKRIATCRELSGIVEGAIGRWGKAHPATRTFQALRIAVNDELGEIKKGLDAALKLLGPEGRIVAISYHSLEDRIVKNFIRDSARMGLLNVLTPKPLRPTQDELIKNPSARSAKMRVAERAN